LREAAEDVPAGALEGLGLFLRELIKPALDIGLAFERVCVAAVRGVTGLCVCGWYGQSPGQTLGEGFAL